MTAAHEDLAQDEDRLRWWQRWRRDTEPEDDGPGAEVVQLHKTLVPAEPEPTKPSAARAAVAKVADRPFPTRHAVKVEVLWWARHAARLIPWLPVLVLRELRPILRGAGRAGRAWSRWASVVELRNDADAAEGNARAKAGIDVENRRTGRIRLSVALGLVWSAGWVWLWLHQPAAAVAVSLVVLAVLDGVGRKGTATATVVPAVALPAVLTDNVPLRQITTSILGAFTREGFEDGSVRVAVPLAWDPARSEYRISVAVQDGIKPEHIRAVERAIGARDYAIRNLATGTATVRELVIRVGDPLAALVERPWVPTGSRSVAQTVSLGESITDVPFAVPFAGVHLRIVAGTGGGKTKWLLRSAIDGLSACRDCVLGGIDITNGPELSLWRGVIQHRGLNVEDAERVLDLALAEIDRRGQILTDIAEDDDPDNDADEWHAGLGPAFVVFVDEFAQLAVYDGKGGKPNLLGKCEQIVRTGRKHWVSLVMLTQKTGNDDFGSTTMSTQCGVSIAGPCDPADAVRMFGVERRDAGYTPHLLSPGVEGDIRDAGKVFIESPMHRTADIYRAYAPGTTAEVKRRARQRISDGLPTLDGRRAEVLDAVEVPPVLAAVEHAFRAAGDPDRMATAELLAWLREGGHEVDENRIAAELRPCGLRPAEKRWSPAPKANPVRGYLLADVRAAVRRVG